MDELVLAIPVAGLWKMLAYRETGFIKGDSDILDNIVRKGMFLKRSVLEEDPSFKQLITYGIITYKETEQSGVGQSQSFYLFRRTAGQTEKRLHGKLHLGAGGHVNPGRQEKLDAQHIVNELKRELFEEVRLLNGCLIEDIKFIGFINDDSIPVGRVHIGLLYDIRVADKNVVVNETDKMTAEWTDKTDLIKHYEEMETWTKISFDYYIK